MKPAANLIPILGLFCCIIGCEEATTVDTIVHNATIYTVDDVFSKQEAMAIHDGKIVEVGPEHAILNKYRAEHKVDLNKSIVFPGFIDAHSHFLGYGLSLQRVNLMGTTSFKDVLGRMRKHQEETGGDWILGRGWDQNDWSVKSFPSNIQFDSLFPDKHIVIKRVDGHAALVSNSVLELAGIDANTTVEGGMVVIGNNGNPTGLLIDEAMSLIDSILPKVDNASKSAAMMKAQEQCFEVGLTTVCDAGLQPSEIELINTLHNQGQLEIRIYAMYSARADILDGSRNIGLSSDKLSAKAIKVYADGAMGSRGAKLLQPYSDDTTTSGFMITPADSISKWAEFCLANNLQLAVHCIGSEGNRTTLNAMGAVLQGTNDRRWRIEHAQMVHSDDRPLFAKFNILPSMQPTHVTSDMYWVQERVGPERLEFTYATKSLMDQNGLVCLGTDFPVEGIDPLHTFYAAVTRMDASNYPDGGFLPSQKLDRIQALKGMTIWAAIASFEEEFKGSVEAGKFADFVVVDKDIITCDEAEILSSNVLQTWLNGNLVYEK